MALVKTEGVENSKSRQRLLGVKRAKLALGAVTYGS